MPEVSSTPTRVQSVIRQQLVTVTVTLAVAEGIYRAARWTELNQLSEHHRVVHAVPQISRRGSEETCKLASNETIAVLSQPWSSPQPALHHRFAHCKFTVVHCVAASIALLAEISQLLAAPVAMAARHEPQLRIRTSPTHVRHSWHHQDVLRLVPLDPKP